MCMRLIVYSELKREININTSFSVFQKNRQNNNINKDTDLNDTINHF